MHLNDRLNPNDGGLIDRLDSSLIRLHQKIAEFWQNKTYGSKETLSKYAHALSSGFFLASAIGGNYSAGILSLNEGSKFVYGIKEVRSRLEEELEAELFHLPRKYFRLFDIVLYGGGVAAVAYGLDNITLSLVASDADSVSKGTKALFVGLGALLWKTGDYLDRVEIGNPPPKPERKSSIEWLRRLLPASSNS